MVSIGRPEQAAHVIRPAGRSAGPEPTRFWGHWSFILGVLAFISDLFLILMFASLGLGRGPDPWGPINDFLNGVTNLMLAALIPVISWRAARGRGERYGVWLLSGASAVGAAASFLLVAGRLGFEQSTAVSMAVIVLQVFWMLWLNRRFSADPGVPRHVIRLGIAFAVSLLAALTVFSVSFLAGEGSWVGTALQAVGGIVGGAAWLSWPLWFILLGRYLARIGRPRIRHSAG